MNILHIDSSPLEGRSVSRALSSLFVYGLMRRFPAATVTRRDVATVAPDHASAEIIDIVRFKKDEELSARQLHERTLSDTLIAELQAADVIVIGSPMDNYTVSTQLKAWIDRVAQAGRTFRYTPNGSVGLLKPGVRALVAISRGGNLHQRQAKSS